MSLISVLTGPVVAFAQSPRAAFVPDTTFGVIGSVIKLDARQSSDPDNFPLSYEWRFVSVPIGSQVQGEGFRSLENESETDSPLIVSFSPDVVGEYVVGLKVSNGVFESEEVTSTIRIRAILVPHGRGIIPDGKFIYSYIRDVWSQVDGKEWFETLWSALIQIVGTEMLKLYQTDFNKSIRDIQDRYQRRWISYEPKLLLAQEDLTFFFGNQLAGQNASTVNLGLEGLAIILSSGEVVVIVGARLTNVSGESFTILYSEDPSNVGTYLLTGLNTARTGYRLSSPDLDPTSDTIATDVRWTFDLGSTSWTIEDAIPSSFAETYSEWAPLSDSMLPIFNRSDGDINDIKKGDVIHIPTGPNAGFYRIVEKSGSFVEVDHAPLGASVSGSIIPSNVYRPVGFTVTQPARSTTNTFSVPYEPGAADASVIAPGRLVVVNGQAFNVVRSVVDRFQNPPVVVVSLDDDGALAGLTGLNWRVPNTLTSSSQNFEELGVSTGDLLIIDVVDVASGASCEVPAQVLGVHENSLGFVVTSEEVEAGVVPSIPNEIILKVADAFNITGVAEGPDGELVYSGMAQTFLNSINSRQFQRNYWNRELDISTDISVNPLFEIKPKYLIRNKLIPVDETLRSVPALQEWIVQPTLAEADGKVYQVVRGKSFELTRRPVILNENFDYIIDDEYAFEGQMTINTGSDEVEVDGGDFLDRGLSIGDEFIINSPLTLAGSYPIERVISNNKLRLTRPVPAFVLGPFAVSNVTLKRKKTGHFLRFVPGLFDAQNPAPARLWSEVSFFDNDQVIEDNFGILVGLTKESLDTVSRDISYRQAVSGLMYAFTRGSALDKVRLGAQILLGLPFAEHRGIVRSIEEDYRLDLAGVPILGRLLIEDVDSTGKPLGTLRIYTYPIDEASALAGIDENPATGLPYVVGDVVELFAPLSKGVEIIDYITNPGDVGPSAIAQLQKFHTVKLRANDNIFSLDELELVSDFLKKITPSYVSYSLITASEFADVVNIADVLVSRMAAGGDNALVDNASLNFAPTLMFNSRSADGANQALIEDGFHSIRRVGFDLVSVDGSSTLSSAAGGFLNPKSNEDFEGPLCEAGDFLIVLSGSNQGVYSISAVPSDTQVTVSGLPFGFEDETDLRFAIVRRVPDFLAAGTSSVTSGNATVTMDGSPHLRTKGVAPGDWLIIDDGTMSYRHIITSVKESSPGSGVWNRVDVAPAPSFTDATTQYSIYRPSLLTPGSFEVTSIGTPELQPASLELFSLVDAGDELITDLPSQQRVTVLAPKSLYVTPTLPAGSYIVTIARKNRPNMAIGWDHIEKFGPIDEVEAVLISQDFAEYATFVSGSAVVAMAVDPLGIGTLPGDLFVVMSGVNSIVDVGYGPGVYPIVEVSTLSLTLATPMSTNDIGSWKIIRRR